MYHEDGTRLARRDSKACPCGFKRELASPLAHSRCRNGGPCRDICQFVNCPSKTWQVQGNSRNGAGAVSGARR